MANYNLFNNLIKEIPSNLRKFIVRRLRRFNAVSRAHKVIEKTAADKGDRAPFPDKIQKQIDEALKNNPELLTTIVNEKNETLLERLKKVFVTSIGENKDMFNKTKLTPIQYNLFKPDTIEEFKENIPEGKFSLKQADRFLREFQRNPGMHTVESLSKRLKIAPNQLMCMLTHTKVFKVSQPINTKSSKPLLGKNLDSMLPSIIETEPDEDKIYRVLERRSTKFRQFYKEKLGLERHFEYVVKNPSLRKVFMSLDITKYQPRIEGPADNQVLAPKDKTITMAGERQTIVVNDLKPGEDPNAFEKVPEFKGIEKAARLRTGGHEPGKFPHHIRSPDDEMEEFDVFKVMEQQDRKTRKEERKREKVKTKEEQKEQLKDEESSGGERNSQEEEPLKLQVRAKVSSENSGT